MSRLFVILAVAVLVASSFAIGPAAADTHPHARTGFFIGFGLGWGNAGANFAGAVDGERENSGSGNFRLGWAVAPSVTLGLENTSWVKNYAVDSTTDLKLTTTATTFAATFFPQNVGVYLRGGIGVATATAKFEGGGLSVSDTEYGLGLLGSVGYEWRLTSKFALGPQLQWTYLNIDDSVMESIDFFSATAQATWYW
jgi:hypothetical protein